MALCKELEFVNDGAYGEKKKILKGISLRKPLGQFPIVPLVSSCSNLVRSVGADGHSSWSSDETAVIRRKRENVRLVSKVAPVRRNVDTGGRQHQEVIMGPVSTLCWILQSVHLLFCICLPSFPRSNHFLCFLTSNCIFLRK